MRKRLAALFVCMLLGVSVVFAQNAIPTIITFTADPSAITVDAAESGQVQTTLAWHVINLPDDDRLLLYQRSLNGWVLAVADTDDLEPGGTRALPVQHPLNFGPPTYRLVLVDGEGQVIDERLLTLDYEITPDQPPEITLFTTSNPTISGDALADGSARVSVSWGVTNRLPTSNLLFEQVMDDGQVVPVELPRENLWIASRGDGVVAPVPPLSGSVVHLRLRVIDVISGDVYAESQVDVAVGGAATVSLITPAATAVVDALGTPVPSATPQNCSISAVDVPLSGAPGDGCDSFRDPISGNIARVASFSIDNPDPGPGRPVTLSWQVEGAQFALLEVYDPRQLAQGGLPEPAQVYYDGLATSGSTTITLPASLTEGARFILWAADLSTEARSPSFLYDRLAYRIIDTGPGAQSAAAEITAFIAVPPTASPGTEITLSWSITGADMALIELYNAGNNAPAGVFDNLPTVGSANIVVPEAFTQGARFVLWAANRAADGSYVRLKQSEVLVNTGS